MLTWVGEVVHQYDAVDLLVENRTKLLIFLLPTDIPKLNKELVLHLANGTNTLCQQPHDTLLATLSPIR